MNPGKPFNPGSTPPNPAPAAMLSCRVCGAQVLQGQAFCEQCGADLRTQPPIVAVGAEGAGVSRPEDATMITPPRPAGSSVPVAPPVFDQDETLFASPPPPPAAPSVPAAPASSDQDETLFAPPPPPPPPAAPSVPAAPPSSDQDETLFAPPSPAAPVPPATPEPAPPPVSDQDETLFAPPSPAAPVPPAPPEPAQASSDQDETLFAPPPPAASVPPDQATVAPGVGGNAAVGLEEERQRLEQEIERHQTTITQMEQMLQVYPAGSAPAYLAAALEDARRALHQAEADLAALPTMTGPDPEEVARLEEECNRHRTTITQMEQMLQVYPAGSAPAYLAAALEDARLALEKAEADLAALYDGATTAAAPSIPSMPAPAAPPAPPAATPAATPPAPPPPPAATPPTPTPAAPEPAPPPAAPSDMGDMLAAADAATVAADAAGIVKPTVSGTPESDTLDFGPMPRLVLADGAKELALPQDKIEITIGREDPVSHIFPEIDLTPFGGETGGVSRQHARIHHTAGQWTVTDLNSTNYTHVNGKRLEPNVPTPIEDGTQLRFGRISTIFRLA